MAKSYNPFKMWGTYFTGILFFLGVGLFTNDCPSSAAFCVPSIVSWFFGDLTYLFSASVALILGFMVSWGITLLWRTLK